jgi:hypothetical protein
MKIPNAVMKQRNFNLDELREFALELYADAVVPYPDIARAKYVAYGLECSLRDALTILGGHATRMSRDECHSRPSWRPVFLRTIR